MKKSDQKSMKTVVRVLRVRSGVKAGAKKALVGSMKKVIALAAME